MKLWKLTVHYTLSEDITNLEESDEEEDITAIKLVEYNGHYKDILQGTKSLSNDFGREKSFDSFKEAIQMVKNLSALHLDKNAKEDVRKIMEEASIDYPEIVI